jgi:hypothetical protein
VVGLRTRGPVDNDMPVYTLRDYNLHWRVAGVQDQEIFSRGEARLPTHAPGTAWATRVEWPRPPMDCVFTLRIIRPTGFTVAERFYGYAF